MFDVTTVVFCEKILQLMDSRYQLIGPYPNQVMFPMSSGTHLQLDVFCMIRIREAGDRHVFGKFINTDGSEHAFSVPVSAPAPNHTIQMAMGGVTFGINRPGEIVVMLGDDKNDLQEAGRLSVLIPHTVVSGAGLTEPGVLIS